MDLSLELQDGVPKRDFLWEAVLEVCGVDERELTQYQRGAYNKACGQLRKVNATPEDVWRRARQYAERFPGATLTGVALARHWAELKPPVPRPHLVVRDGEMHVPGTGWVKLDQGEA